MEKKKVKDEKKFMETARKNLKRGLESDAMSQQKSKYMAKFLYLNEQWDEAERRKRDENRRSMLTFPILKQFCNQVVNEVRQNTINVEVTPSDNKGTYKIARILEGHIRDILYNNKADAIFDQACQASVFTGLGMFSVSTEDSEVNPFIQDIIIKAEDPETIIMDPDASSPDLSDSEFWAKTYAMPKERFKNEYKGKFDEKDLEEKTSKSFIGNLPLTSNYQGWYKEGYVQLCEYYVKEYNMEVRVLLSDGNEYSEEEAKKKIIEDKRKRKMEKQAMEMMQGLDQAMQSMPPLPQPGQPQGQPPQGPNAGPNAPQAGMGGAIPQQGPAQPGMVPTSPSPMPGPNQQMPQPPQSIMPEQKEKEELKELDRKEVNVGCWYHYIIYGDGILVGPEEFVGDQPFFPVFGLIGRVDGKRVWSGLVNDGVYAQKLINEWMTDTAERLKNTPKFNYFVTPHLVKQYEALWKRSNEVSLPMLPINPDPSMPQGPIPVQHQPPVVDFQAITQVQQFVMQAVGMYKGDVGGKIGMVQTGIGEAQAQRPGDTGAFHFADNLNRAKDALIRNLVKMVLKLYDTERDVRMMDDEDKVGYTRINARAKDVLKAYKSNQERYGNVDIDDLEQFISSEGDEAIYNKMTGKYAVKTKPSPAFSTMRDEAKKELYEYLGIASKMPPTPENDILKYELAKSMDGLAGAIPKLRDQMILKGLEEPKREEMAKIQQKMQLNAAKMMASPQAQKMKADIQNKQQAAQLSKMKQSNEQLKHQENILKLQNSQTELQHSGIELTKEISETPDNIKEIVEQLVFDILSRMMRGEQSQE
jgi:Phage P22-like portal protein